jgi:broad specificity phosphatase PhoE
MPPPLRLLLVRHGEAHSNREMRYLGSLDEPLTELGHRQADRVAAALSQLPIAAVYASPLRRAAQTGERIAAGLGITMVAEPRLREQSFGQWEGLTRAQVLDRSQGDRELLAAWEADAAAAPPGGESLEAVAGRVRAMAADLTLAHPGAWIAVVSHVGPIKALLCTALAVPLAAARRLFLDPATLSVIDWGEAPVVRLFNSHEHLGWREARWMR